MFKLWAASWVSSARNPLNGDSPPPQHNTTAPGKAAAVKNPRGHWLGNGYCSTKVNINQTLGPMRGGGRLWWNARRTTDFQEKCYFTQAFKGNERPSLARYWQDPRRSELEGTLAHNFWSPCWPSGEVRVKKDPYPLQSIKRSLPLRRCKHAKSNLICLGYTFDWQSPAFWSWKRWMAAQPLQ